jgi:Ni/Co efflux regulator RcnB
MKSKKLVCAIIALSFFTANLSFAQGKGNQNWKCQNGQGPCTDAQDGRGGNQDRRGNQGRRNEGGQYQQGRADNQERRDQRGVGPDHGYYRGDRLPIQYRSRQYVVEDWRGHRLSAPPRGYHWVQSGGDYVLVAIATGVILQLLLNN